MEVATGLWDIFMSERLCLFRTVAAGVGVVWLLKTAYCTLSFLCPFVKAYFLAPLGIFRPNLKKYGPWAVVTGASEGIGKGYATELARRGLNVVIMSRSQEKLDKVAEEIREKYSVQVKVVAVDFLAGQDVYPEIASELQDLEIGVLVNNVGLAYEYPEYFHQVSPQRFRNIIELNCQTMVQMTHLFLPKMVERKRGLVVNISSMAGLFPIGQLTVYSATKSFVVFFSGGLDQEYSSKGIVVQTITPGLVPTSMSRVKKTSFFAPSPSSFASSALNTVGHFSCNSGCIPHVLQFIQLEILKLWPSLFKRISRIAMKEMKETMLPSREREKKE